MLTKVKASSEIQAMREGGQILATVLEKLKQTLQPGQTTKYLADVADKELKRLGGKPAFLGYKGAIGVRDFPDVICISLNEEVVHGIPSESRIIKEGDLVSLDFGVIYKGMVTDSAISIIAGKAKPEHQKLLDITYESMMAGIKVVKDSVQTEDIGAAVQQVLDRQNYGIIRDLVGHGVG